MRQPKPREIPVRGKSPIRRPRCTRSQPSQQRATRRGTDGLTRIAPSPSFGVAAPKVQPLRSLTELARSIFDAAWDLVDDGVAADLVKS